MSAIQFRALPGGQYEARQESDGTWTIFDVPIFAELQPGQKGTKERIGRDWMLRAIQRHQDMELQEQHLPPVHANHHDYGRETPLIGFFRLTRVGSVLQKGKNVDALFADLIGIKEDQFQAITAMQFPYRSVEISRWADAEIASLALLEDEAPFFKLPMLSIGKAVSTTNEELHHSFAVAMRHSARRGDMILFSFSGGKEEEMPTPKKKTATKKEAQLQDGDGDKDEEDDEKMEDGGGGVVIDPGELKEMIMQMIKDAMGVKEEAPEAPEVEPAQLSEKDKENTELAAQVAFLMGENKKRTEADKVAALCSSTVAGLRDAGWHIDDDAQADLRKQLEKSSDPDETAKVFAETWKRIAPKDPAKKLDDVGADDATEVHESLKKFADKGPEVLAAAEFWGRQYDNLQDQGTVLSASRDEYIECNLEEPIPMSA